MPSSRILGISVHARGNHRPTRQKPASYSRPKVRWNAAPRSTPRRGERRERRYKHAPRITDSLGRASVSARVTPTGNIPARTLGARESVRREHCKAIQVSTLTIAYAGASPPSVKCCRPVLFLAPAVRRADGAVDPSLHHMRFRMRTTGFAVTRSRFARSTRPGFPPSRSISL